MKRPVLAQAIGAMLTLGIGVTASAAPSNFPTNPNACVGISSTTANVTFQDVDPSKFRSMQAREDDGQPCRADSVAVIQQCAGADVSRGIIK
jgi:hypothetical protein